MAAPCNLTACITTCQMGTSPLKSEHQGLSDPKVAAGGSLSAAGMAPKQPKSERDTARLLPDKVERSIALPADEFSDLDGFSECLMERCKSSADARETRRCIRARFCTGCRGWLQARGTRSSFSSIDRSGAHTVLSHDTVRRVYTVGSQYSNRLKARHVVVAAEEEEAAVAACGGPRCSTLEAAARSSLPAAAAARAAVPSHS